MNERTTSFIAAMKNPVTILYSSIPNSLANSHTKNFMQDIPKKILDAVTNAKYRPLKPKALARKIGVDKRYDDFKTVLKDLIKTGQVKLDKNHTIRPVGGDVANAIAGIFRKTGSGIGFVRPHSVGGVKAEE